MSETSIDELDCVSSVRAGREEIGAEIERAGIREFARQLRMHRFSDPFLQALADRARSAADTTTSTTAQ